MKIIDKKDFKWFENLLAWNYSLIQGLINSNTLTKEEAPSLMRQMADTLEDALINKIEENIKNYPEYYIGEIYFDKDLPACFGDLDINTFYSFSCFIKEAEKEGLNRIDVYNELKEMYIENKKLLEYQLDSWAGMADSTSPSIVLDEWILEY
jgi:hypothetical protein